MDFTFLFDPARKLFSIGFNVTERRRDASYYDLLASEARLCSYVAIALGQVPQDHWFSLGRLLVASHGEPILVSWSGSMFEYLMPLLVMPNYENTLLDHTCRAAVQQQIEYGRIAGRAVGHFRIGLQPHRRAPELPVPRLWRAGPGFETRTGGRPGDRAVRHRDGAHGRTAGRVRKPATAGGRGRTGAYGFYEAVDYTPSRLPPDETSATSDPTWRTIRG
jgi:cyclic beta-1,2-glucan synthetase